MNSIKNPDLLDLLTYEIIWYVQTKPLHWNILRKSLLNHLSEKYPQCFNDATSIDSIMKFNSILRNGESKGWISPYTRQTRKGPKTGFSHPVEVKGKNNSVTVFKMIINVGYDDNVFSWCQLPSCYRNGNVVISQISKWCLRFSEKKEFIQIFFGMSMRHWFRMKKELTNNFDVRFADKRRRIIENKDFTLPKVPFVEPTKQNLSPLEDLSVLMTTVLNRLTNLEEEVRQEKEIRKRSNTESSLFKGFN